MPHRFKIALLALGVLLGYGSGFAHLQHWHHHHGDDDCDSHYDHR
jgi:hypothetical protein